MRYTKTAGISPLNRSAVEALHRAGGPFTISDAAKILDREVAGTRRLLAYLARRGWLTRVRHGLYIPVPLEANLSGEWSTDPWIVATVAFAPCYIGGWSALEHWALTEQLFRTVVVFSARPIRKRAQDLQGIPVQIKVVASRKLFGAVPVWRDQHRVDVSDPSRTLIDVLDDPSIGAGMNHVAGAVAEYFGSDHRKDELLVEYGDRLGNNAVFKRLGYLIETLGVDAPLLVDACKARRSAGVSVLDPAVKRKGRILRRWGLRVNVDLAHVETWS